MQSFLTFNVAILLAAAIGGMRPIIIKGCDRVLHLFLALTTGVFLGAVFIHLIPEVAKANPSATTWILVLSGLLIVYALETLVFPGRYLDAEDAHSVVAYATFAGLSIHSYAAGLGLAAAFGRPSLGIPVFLSILAHKLAAAFSLCTVFQLAEFKRTKTIFLLACFSCITPLGAVTGYVTFANASSSLSVFLTAIATGTFLYVALCDLMPEVFHRPHDNGAKLLLLLVGVGIMWVLSGV